MKSLFLAVSAAALIVVAPAIGQTTNSKPSASPSMKNFIEHVARDGKAAVDLARLAQQKAQNPDVKA